MRTNKGVNRGFTLIELLAVIVILAVIALIATPIVIGIIEDSRESAFKSSLYSIFDATEYKLVQDKNTVFPSEGIDVSSLTMNNNKFTSGTVFQDDKGMYLENVSDGKYCGKGYKDKLEVVKGKCNIYTDKKYFTFDKNTGTITNYSNEGPKDVVIPSSIDGVSVEHIRDYAFTSVGLTSIVIPETVKTIGIEGFSGNQLTSIIIPDSVEEIKEYAFAVNFLTSVKIPKSISEISEGVFLENKLRQVTIPDSVTSIGSSAFYDNQLTNIYIPNSVTTIGTEAFNNNQLSDDQAFIYNRNNDGSEDKSSLNSYGGAKRENVIIPNGIITIGQASFQGTNITSVTIPDSVRTIKSGAFQANKLTAIEIPNNVITIESSAFAYNKLATVIIGNHVTSIGNIAFDGNKLTNVIIPNSVTSIAKQAFSKNQLTSVKIIGKSSSNDFTTYETSIWGWETGYNDSNIIWNATE